MKRFRFASFVVASLVSSAAFATGCSASTGRGSAFDASPSGVSPDGDASVDGVGAAPDAFTFDTSALDVPPSVPDAVGEACAATTETASLIPLDIFIMLDQSLSMNDPTPKGTKWEGVTAALSDFMKAPSTVGVGVGIQYFGLPSAADPTVDSCLAADYATADVPIAALPGVRPAIESSLAAHSPTTITPTGPALQGAIQYAQAWQAKNPTHVVVVLLATDGQPTECDVTDIPTIAGYAKTARTATPSIRTYVIGVLADADLAAGADTNMNDISKAGNGADAFIVKSATADVTAAFVAALNKIRGTALACQYEVPKGVGADYTKVNVNVGSGSGPSSILPYVATLAKCDPSTGGWYYDVDPAVGAPTKILLCNASCKALGSSPSATIDIQVGCATQGPGIH